MEVEPRWPPLSGSLVLWEVYIHHTGFSRDTQTSADDRALDVATSFVPHGLGSGHCRSIIHCPYVPHVHIIYVLKVVKG